jgi:hypothetical protein
MLIDPAGAEVPELEHLQRRLDPSGDLARQHQGPGDDGR